MTIINKYFFTALSVAVCMLIGMASCKKGCTDPAALNYSAHATEDGSCKFCDSSVADYGSLAVFVGDQQNQGPHFNQNVIDIGLQMKKQVFNGNSCAALHMGLDNSCNTYYGYPTFYNLTGDTMLVYCTLNLFEANSGARSSKGVVVTLPPYATVTTNDLCSTCIPKNVEAPDFTLNTSGASFHYH